MKIFKCLCFLVAFLHTFHQVPSQNLPRTLGAECDNCSFGADKSPEGLCFHGYPGASLISVISVDVIYFCLLIGKGFCKYCDILSCIKSTQISMSSFKDFVSPIVWNFLMSNSLKRYGNFEIQPSWNILMSPFLCNLQKIHVWKISPNMINSSLYDKLWVISIMEYIQNS